MKLSSRNEKVGGIRVSEISKNKTKWTSKVLGKNRAKKSGSQ